MRAVYEFHCKCGNKEDHYEDSSIREIPCENCGELMQRIISPPSLMKIDGAYGGLHSDRWAKIREDNARRKAKYRRDHGED